MDNDSLIDDSGSDSSKWTSRKRTRRYRLDSGMDLCIIIDIYRVPKFIVRDVLACVKIARKYAWNVFVFNFFFNANGSNLGHKKDTHLLNSFL